MNHEAPRVLFLAPVEPWGRDNGSSLVIADLLEGLARSPGAQLFAVFMRRPPAGFEGTPPKGVDSVTLGVEGRARWASTLIAAARGTSPLRTRFANGRVMRMVARAVAERGFRPTIVHVEHLPLIDIGLKLARRDVVCDSQRIDTLLAIPL